MRINALTVLATMAIFTLGTVSAEAKPPKPPADCGIDADGDGWCVPDSSRTMPATPPATGTVPFHKGAVDCNDADKHVNPGATEKVGDGIDNDCVGGDATAPVWASKFGCSKSNARCIAHRAEEITRCNADANCTVNMSAGRFVVKWGHMFYDADCDGKREVMTIADRETLDRNARARGHVNGHKCASKRTHRKRRAPKKGAAATPANAKRTVEAPKADPRVDKLDKDVAGLGSRVTEVEGNLGRYGKDLEGVRTDLTRVERESLERDKMLGERVDGFGQDLTLIRTRTSTVESGLAGVSRLAGANSRRLDSLGQSGFLIELMAGLYLGGQQSVAAFDKKGKEIGSARGSFVLGPEFSLNIGAWLPSARVNAFGGVTLPFEEGPSGDMDGGMAGFVGAEYLWRLGASDDYVGIHGMFRSHDSGGDVLGSNVVAMGGGGGLSYAHVARPEDEVGFVVGFLGRAGCGAEQLGTKGDGFRATGASWFCGASLGGTFGFSTSYKSVNDGMRPLAPRG